MRRDPGAVAEIIMSKEKGPGRQVWCGGYQGEVVDVDQPSQGQVRVRIASGVIVVNDHAVVPRRTPDVPRARLEALAWRHERPDRKSRRRDGTRCVIVHLGNDDVLEGRQQAIESLTDAQLMAKLPTDVLDQLARGAAVARRQAARRRGSASGAQTRNNQARKGVTTR